MGKLRAEQRVKLIKFYFEHQCSLVLTWRLYMRHFNERNPLSKPAVLALIRQFQQKNSVQVLSRTGRPC